MPQTVYRFRRRQERNLEVDFERAAERPGLSARLPQGHGRGGGDPEADFSDIYKQPQEERRAHRPILSVERSLGSVIKLLTPSADYTDEYNAWLRDLHQTIRQLVFSVKRYYRPEWGENWMEHFTVDRINGFLGHELKYDDQKMVGNYLRVGFDPDGSWRIYKLRPDFHPAWKVQMEDDITASVVVPRARLGNLDTRYSNPSVKLVANCESLLFQRPDDAVHRGFDAQAEADLASPGTFISNFEPLSVEQVKKLVDHVAEFDKYTEPMKQLLTNFASGRDGSYVVSSANARLVDGVPTKNPRYLQKRPDIVNAAETYLAEVSARLDRKVPSDQQVYFPVGAVLAGRRGNPPDAKIGLPPLAVYNPIHYQDLPELFMDFVCSLTGKSPSTTGFGSEGALTKGPFNALWPIVDLNNALVSFISRNTPASRQRRARLDRTSGWITISACWCLRCGAGCGCRSANRSFSSTTAIWKSSKISSWMAARCKRAGSATGSRRCLPTAFWDAFSRRRTRCSQRSYCGRRSKTRRPSRRAWIALSNRSAASP